MTLVAGFVQNVLFWLRPSRRRYRQDSLPAVWAPQKLQPARAQVNVNACKVHMLWPAHVEEHLRHVTFITSVQVSKALWGICALRLQVVPLTEDIGRRVPQ